MNWFFHFCPDKFLLSYFLECLFAIKRKQSFATVYVTELTDSHLTKLSIPGFIREYHSWTKLSTLNFCLILIHFLYSFIPSELNKTLILFSSLHSHPILILIWNARIESWTNTTTIAQFSFNSPFQLTPAVYILLCPN